MFKDGEGLQDCGVWEESWDGPGLSHYALAMVLSKCQSTLVEAKALKPFSCKKQATKSEQRQKSPA